MKKTTLPRFWLFSLLAVALATGLTPKLLAQSKPYVANIRVDVDTVGKRVKFKYDLLRAEPEDSIYIQIETPDNAFYPKAVQGEIGTNLTPGYDKTFFWNPLADHRKINDKVNIIFIIRTFSSDDSLSGKRRGLVFTKRQIIDYSRWTVSAALTAITLVKGKKLMDDINDYNGAAPPINALEKIGTDQQKAALDEQKRQFYPWVAISGASILINAIYTLARPKARPALQRLSWQPQGNAISLTYTF